MFFLASFWHKLELWDQWLFTLINSDWTSSFLDPIMLFVRNPLHWAPLYLFIFVFVMMNFKAKGLWWAVFLLATVALTDMVGNYVFKHGFQRTRPCNDQDFAMHVRLLVDRCGAGYSFVSNHAANHFGMAVFFFITFRRVIGKWVWLGLVWAGLVAYSQVYVGLHYPLDVLGGALLGVVFGITTATVFNKRFGFGIFGNQPVL